MISRSIALLLILFLVTIVRQYPLGDEAYSLSNPAISLGLVILAGYLLGEIGARLHLPRITGYILTGIALGPYVSGFISPSDVKSFTLIDRVALALIALSAGGEFQLASLAKRWKGIAWITLLQTIGVFGLGMAFFYAIAGWLPFLAGLPISSQLGCAMVFGVLAIAQSPATTIAVINESRSAGATTETVLGITVIKDVLVIVVFTALLPIVRLMEQGGEFQWGFLGALGSEIFLSIAAGVVAGWCISLYLRFVKLDPVLFILVFAFLISEGSHMFHLDTLVVCIAAGIWVTNASKKGNELIHMIEESSLTIYVIFFTITGAGLDMLALQHSFGIAMTLVLVRMASIALTTWIGVQCSRDVYPSVSTMWMLFLPQAGVILGLVSILVREGMEWGPGIQTIIVAVVAINQIIGPILMKYALQQAGEAGQARRKGRAK